MHPHWVAVDLRQSQLGLRLILSNTIAAPTITATMARTETIQKDQKRPKVLSSETTQACHTG